MGTIYLRPTGNKENISKKFQTLSDEILQFQEKGKIILQGDLNAHTGIKEDMIQPNKFDQDVEINENFELPSRNSEHTSSTNIRGDELLELCKAHNLVILNGRKTGDPWGKITSYQWNGTAVVDYVITSLDLFKNITSFKVGDYSPWVSDHCPLLFEMIVSKTLKEVEKEKLEKLPKSFHIGPEDRKKFIETLKSPEMIGKLTSIGLSEKADPQGLTTKITDVLIETCDKAGIKPKKQKQGDKSHEPWFDKECEDLKNSIKRKCRKLRKTQKDKALHNNILNDNKLLKKLIKRKKEEYRLGIIQDMNLKKGDQKLFWKLLDKLQTQNKDIFKNHISGKRWNEHFKSVLINDGQAPNFPPDSQENGQLDYPITMDELDKASYILKPNKASGYDSVSNEMILCLLEIKPDLLIRLFNEVFASNRKIYQWTVALITPIFKKGVKMNPGNYRGISVLSCLGKLFTSILNQRLLRYVFEKNILSKEQLGFIAGNRTSDAHLILHNLSQQYCHKRGQRIFACFVDFQKAFDSVPRDILFTKLAQIGISGKFFNTLKTLYENDVCRVKLDNGLTNTFIANQGVKQGCILSPLLFNIFLADLPGRLSDDSCKPVKIDESNRISCIIWADDIVLLSESEEGLQCMLNKLSQYTKENRMEINADKTKGMILNKSGKFFRRSFAFNSELIFTTNSYKYLGFIVTPSGEITSGLKDLKDRALRAYYKLKKMMGNYFRLHPNITLHLFDTLIKPILLYNSDFWGCLKVPVNNPIENVHMRFCKDLLGVQRQTSNIGVLLELGRMPIMLHGRKHCIKNWGRIHITRRANEIVGWSHLNSIENQLKWTLSVTDCLNRMGIGGRDIDIFVHVAAMRRMADIFHQEAFAEINRDGSKLRTYAKIKQEQGLENYLSNIKNVERRITVSKIRLSNHDLMIEKGRHQKLEINQRNCPFCPGNLLEDEFHFLLTCKTFSRLRNELFLRVKHFVPRFEHLPMEQQLKTLFSDGKLVNFTGIYLQKSLELRRFILTKHKNVI